MLNLDLCIWQKRLSSELVCLWSLQWSKLFHDLKIKCPAIKQKLWSTIVHNFVLFKLLMNAGYLIFKRLTARRILCLKLFILWCDYRLVINESDFCSNCFLTLMSCSTRDSIFSDPISIEKLLNNWHTLIGIFASHFKDYFNTDRFIEWQTIITKSACMPAPLGLHMTSLNGILTDTEVL